MGVTSSSGQSIQNAHHHLEAGQAVKAQQTKQHTAAFEKRKNERMNLNTTSRSYCATFATF